MQPSTHGKVHWKESARRTGNAKWAGYRQLLFIGEKLIDPFDEAKGLEPRSEDLSNNAGALAELDLNKLTDFYLAMGWQADAEAAFFFENLRLQDLSLEELKVLYLMQLTESKKMSDPLAKLCQLDSEGWL